MTETANPAIILSLGRPRLLPVGAIAIDLKNNCFWRGVRRRPRIEHSTDKNRYKSASFRIIALLMIQSPNVVTHAEIADFLCGDDPEGGPNNDKNYIAKRIDIARHVTRNPILPWLNAEIVTRYGIGYALEFTPKPPLQADLSKSTEPIAEIQE